MPALIQQLMKGPNTGFGHFLKCLMNKGTLLEKRKMREGAKT
jgi:hypothetical protein